jgi:hypothetical protein
VTHRFGFVAISLVCLAACRRQAPDADPPNAADSLASRQPQAQNALDTSPNGSNTNEPFEPIHKRWVPGKKSSAPFDRRSRIRARADQLSMDVLVLALDTSASGLLHQGSRFDYVVADSAVVRALRANEVFSDYCRLGSERADGRIGGVVNSGIYDQWQRPRFAWQFDTVALLIRSMRPDSVSCVLMMPD